MLPSAKRWWEEANSKKARDLKQLGRGEGIKFSAKEQAKKEEMIIRYVDQKIEMELGSRSLTMERKQTMDVQGWLRLAVALNRPELATLCDRVMQAMVSRDRCDSDATRTSTQDTLQRSVTDLFGRAQSSADAPTTTTGQASLTIFERTLTDHTYPPRQPNTTTWRVRDVYPHVAEQFPFFGELSMAPCLLPKRGMDVVALFKEFRKTATEIERQLHKTGTGAISAERLDEVLSKLRREQKATGALITAAGFVSAVLFLNGDQSSFLARRLPRTFDAAGGGTEGNDTQALPLTTKKRTAPSSSSRNIGQVAAVGLEARAQQLSLQLQLDPRAQLQQQETVDRLKQEEKTQHLRQSMGDFAEKNGFEYRRWARVFFWLRKPENACFADEWRQLVSDDDKSDLFAIVEEEMNARV